MNNRSLIARLNNSHDEIVNRGRINGQLPLDHIFGFCKTLKKKNKTFSIHSTFKTGDLQKIIFTSKANDIDVLLPNSDTRVMFKESIEKKITKAYDSWYTERKLSTDGNELQFDIARAQHINSPN